jgi:hypothetical protein
MRATKQLRDICAGCRWRTLRCQPLRLSFSYAALMSLRYAISTLLFAMPFSYFHADIDDDYVIDFTPFRHYFTLSY